MADFGGYTLEQLRARVLKALRVNTTVRYSSTGLAGVYDWIDESLNDSQNEDARYTGSIKASWSIATLTSGTRTYDASAGFLDLIAASYWEASDGYTELPIKSIKWLKEHFDDWRYKTGTPKYIYIDEIHTNKVVLGLYPTPDATTGTTYPYVKCDIIRLPIVLVAGAKPEIPKTRHANLVKWAAGELLMNQHEDSTEYKRGMALKIEFYTFLGVPVTKLGFPLQGKTPLRGRDLRCEANIWSHHGEFPWSSDSLG